jgi:DNA-binding response OmpR family regulator
MALRILAVDDDPEILLLERKILESEGYEVTTASNAQEALAAISAKKFNLVLLDIMMPETDGLEVSRQIQQRTAGERLPVVFVTAKDDSGTMREGFRSGGTVFLAKPFTSRQLLGVVRALIGKSA